MRIFNDRDVQELREMFPVVHASMIARHANTADAVVCREVGYEGDGPAPMLLRAAAHAIVVMQVAKDRNDSSGFAYGRDSFWWAIDNYRKGLRHE